MPILRPEKSTTIDFSFFNYFGSRIGFPFAYWNFYLQWMPIGRIRLQGLLFTKLKLLQFINTRTYEQDFKDKIKSPSIAE